MVYALRVAGFADFVVTLQTVSHVICMPHVILVGTRRVKDVDEGHDLYQTKKAGITTCPAAPPPGLEPGTY